MPDGQAHAIATMALVVSVPYAGFLLEVDRPSRIIIAIGILSTLFVNPDLDLRTRMPKDIRRIPAFLYWYPYAKLTPHRSFISHSPIISTLIRWLYILPLILLVLLGLGADRGDIIWFCRNLLLGMCISDVVHILMDRVSTFAKRLH